MDAVALYRAEREKSRVRKVMRRHEYQRALCEYCGENTAHNTGHRRQDGSMILRKRLGKYICGVCHAGIYKKASLPIHSRLDIQAY